MPNKPDKYDMQIIRELQHEVTKLQVELARLQSSKENSEKDISEIKLTIFSIEQKIDLLKKDIAKEFVNSDKFEPVKLLVYGLITVILLAFAAAVVKFFIITPVIATAVSTVL